MLYEILGCRAEAGWQDERRRGVVGWEIELALSAKPDERLEILVFEAVLLWV